MATGNATAKPFVCQKSDGEGESDLEVDVFDDESSRHSVFPRARPQSDSSVNPELTDSRGGVGTELLLEGVMRRVTMTQTVTVMAMLPLMVGARKRSS
jgi:hypothetical protein